MSPCRFEPGPRHQEESRSISENVKWGIHRRFSEGKVSLPYKQFLGYEKGEDGRPKVVEEEAKVVRLIYRLYLEGKTPSGIARQLTADGIPTPAGKVRWQPSTVKSILSNEKYKGDAVLGKRFTVDFLTKKRIDNKGESPMYMVENSHRPIVSPEAYDLVQHEFQVRKARNAHSGASCFSSRIVCGECGGYYGSKLWHSTSKYRRTVWQCNRKFRNDERCKTPHLYEDAIKHAFVNAFNHVLSKKNEILSGYEEIIGRLTDTAALEEELERVNCEIRKATELIEGCIARNAATIRDQEEYLREYECHAARYDRVRELRIELLAQIEKKRARRNQLQAYIRTLSERDGLLTDFDGGLFTATVDCIVVNSTDKVTFRFKDGSEVPWTIAPGK